LKHPIVGDDLYGGGRYNMISDVNVRNQVRKLGRQVLHAERLGFRQPTTGKFIQFQAPLPDELTQLLQMLEVRCG
jgi:23S rRNA pseudouridine1911/1915/1917 synthase